MKSLKPNHFVYYDNKWYCWDEAKVSDAVLNEVAEVGDAVDELTDKMAELRVVEVIPKTNRWVQNVAPLKNAIYYDVVKYLMDKIKPFYGKYPKTDVKTENGERYEA